VRVHHAQGMHTTAAPKSHGSRREQTNTAVNLACPPCVNGAAAAPAGLGAGQATKAELQELFGSGDIDTCLRIILDPHLEKQLAVRSKAQHKYEALAPGSGNRMWFSSGLPTVHR